MQTLQEIQQLLKHVKKATIIMHRGPDGDAVGSALGWSRVLQQLGVHTTVIAPDVFADFLHWLPAADEIVVFEQKEKEAAKAIEQSDVIFCLDFNAPDRMGAAQQAVTGANKPIVVVDHHRFPADFAQVYYVDDQASSTAELIYRLTVELGHRARIDRDTALCLYTGLVTDTGSFRFSSVHAGVLRIAAELLDTGMQHTQVYDAVYDNNRPEALRLKGYALSEKLVVTGGGEVAYISLSKEELKRFQFRPGDTEGLVNYALSVRGVHLAAFFAEKDDLVKISLRSKGKVDVNLLARAHFDGGGHIHAAGGRSHSSLDDTLKSFEKVVAELEKIPG